MAFAFEKKNKKRGYLYVWLIFYYKNADLVSWFQFCFDNRTQLTQQANMNLLEIYLRNKIFKRNQKNNNAGITYKRQVCTCARVFVLFFLGIVLFLLLLSSSSSVLYFSNAFHQVLKTLLILLISWVRLKCRLFS